MKDIDENTTKTILSTFYEKLFERKDMINRLMYLKQVGVIAERIDMKDVINNGQVRAEDIIKDDKPGYLGSKTPNYSLRAAQEVFDAQILLKKVNEKQKSQQKQLLFETQIEAKIKELANQISSESLNNTTQLLLSAESKSTESKRSVK